MIMEYNKKLSPYISPIKSYVAGMRSMEQLPTDPNKSVLYPHNQKNFQKYEVIIQNQKLENEIKLIEWRSKTELPIVKILFYKILQKKVLNQCSVIQVAIQSFPCNLNTLPKMPLYQLLYILKESLFGFERLFDRFGAFDITSRMILINKHSKCKVWINQNITLNHPSRKTKLSQCQFLGKIVKIFEDKCLKSTLSKEFFEEIITFDRISQSIDYLDNFVKVHKIVTPNKLNSITESLGSKMFLEKHEYHLERIQECKNVQESIRKVPKFLTQCREEKAQSPHNKSYDSPKKDKSLIKGRDHSQVKPRFSKQEDNSNSKSNLTPKSHLSNQNHKETKSNIDNKETKPLITRTLKKRRSQQCLHIKPQEFKPYQTGTEKLIQIKEEQVNEELYFTKIPNKQPQQKYRKFSTNNNKEPFVHNNFSKTAMNSKKIQISQLTATTIDDNHKKNNFSTHPQTPQSPQTPKKPITPPMSQSPHGNQTTFTIMQEKEMSIFEKNKWIKRMDSLTGQNARDTINSLHDGVDTFSQEFARVAQNLNLLGTMGKELKGSFMDDQN